MSGKHALREENVFALLENTRAKDNEPESLLFADPVVEICCYSGEELGRALTAIDKYRKDGYYLCGYMNYEAAYFIVDKMDFPLPLNQDYPMLHFYAFRDVKKLTSQEASAFMKRVAQNDVPVAIQNIELNTNNADYIKAISKIQAYILDGESYQINFTVKYRFQYQGTPVSLYRRLRERQRVEFGALLKFPEFGVLSLSPELFLRKRGIY
ncbi:MAG TPA: chorismate-binding protein, partial [Beijerinckiaceae bacterium]|nr:chorismate-binding protein [Beijerinckiaceae bacterium]